MSDLLRESPAGQLVRYFTKDKIFKYLEEKEGFQCPYSYSRCDSPGKALGAGSNLSIRGTLSLADENEKSKEEEVPGPDLETAPPQRLRTTDTVSDSSLSILVEDAQPISPTSEVLSRITSRIDLENITTRRDLERAYTEATMRSQVKKAPTQPITPEKTGDGTILVDWYDTDDQENPQNWSFGKKCGVALVI
jgi:DHA1 family multidrug resistance protein-like MFS transporter